MLPRALTALPLALLLSYSQTAVSACILPDCSVPAASTADTSISTDHTAHLQPEREFDDYSLILERSFSYGTSEIEFDTVGVERELDDEPGMLSRKKRYRLPNLLNSDIMRISLKGNITVPMMGDAWRDQMNMKHSDLYLRIKDQGAVTQLVFKERF